MDTTTARLEKCFQTIFPKLAHGDVQQASVNTVPQWDSVAHVTLLTLVGEEFGIPVDFEDFEGMSSFPDILRRVQEQLAG